MQDVCERVGELLGVSMDRVSVMDTEQNFMDVKQQTPRKKGLFFPKWCHKITVVFKQVLGRKSLPFL